MDSYLSSERDRIFSNVAVMIYIFDVTSDTSEVKLCTSVCAHFPSQ